MSAIKDLIQMLMAGNSRHVPLRDAYHKACHKQIEKLLGKKANSCVDDASFWKSLAEATGMSDARIEVSDGEKTTIIADADKSMNHVFNLLGSGDMKLDPIQWSADFIHGHEWKSGTYYRKYNQVDLSNNADVKVPREISRCHHLLRLALAYSFTGEEKYAKTVVDHVKDWIDENPLMYSINWGCAMDVGIRAVNWIWALSLLENYKADAIGINKIKVSLYQHGWFIYRNLEGNQFRYNNNHYYSDLVGLLHIAALFKGDRQAEEWFSFALKEFYRETRLQVLPSGLEYEGSTSYHRLVTELLVTAIVFLNRLGEEVPIDIMARCESMFDVAYKLMMPDGTMPIVGDQDNGRCLPWGVEGINDCRYLMSLGAALFKRGDLKAEGNGFNTYCAIFGDHNSYESFSTIREKKENRNSVFIRDAGLAIMRLKNDYLLFNADNQGMYRDDGSTLSHTHSDWFSFVLCVEGVPFIIDPGTHVYSSDADSRNLFRSTRMHNTVVVDGQNQSKIYEKKLWDLKRIGKVIDTRWESDNDMDFISCTHTGYEILSFPVKHQRCIKFDKIAGSWTIEDYLTSEGTHCYEVHFHLADKVTTIVKDNTCYLERNGVRIQMSFESDTEMCIKTSETYLSESYGHKVQSNEIIVSLKDNSIKLVTDIIKC